MQLQLPFFPTDTRMINSNVGVFSKDEFVYFLFNGSPIYCCLKDDLNNFRFIVANLVVNHLCTCSEISHALGIHVRNVQRYVKALNEKGVEWFFNREERRGQCFKFTESVKKEAQTMIDKGRTPYSTAKELGLSESTIYYHVRKGNLKKKN
ncbi:MAG: hypothetical protein KBF06_04715 [Bacteroidales bacterium]|nr:hypothetical protein [Bacteroidales bacterium]NMD16509.1 hypothetical protein [Bacteroidales bacterium]HNQ60693.1 hypothetical protein [Bacteroidales bacterium]